MARRACITFYLQSGSWAAKEYWR